MGNCLSSEKPLSDPGNAQSKRHNDNLSTKQVDLNKTQNSGSESNSPDTKVGTLQKSSSGSTTSPQDGSHEIKGDDTINHSDARLGNGTNSVQTNGGANGNAGPNSLPGALPSQDSKGRQEVKILLLGSGESGKSTILKQMKILHQNGYSQEDLLMYKTTVYKNLLDCAKSIVAALEQFDLSITTDKQPESENGDNSPDTLTDVVIAKGEDVAGVTNEELDFIKSSIISPDPDTVFDPKLASIIARLWAHPTVKRLFKEQRAQFYIMDSAPYFFNNVERIGGHDYIPNVADILRARIKTTGIYDTRFEMGKLNIHMFDVGGQRSERRKWINCFDNVTLIIFCVALSEYDQVLLEETSQNRMAESLVLFESIINSRWFARTSVVLFLNKIDVFTEKLPYSPLENYFPDYAGGNDIKNAAKYILWRFNKLNRNNVNIYPHLTQATDTSNIRLVFAAVKETILQNSLRDSGIL